MQLLHAGGRGLIFLHVKPDGFTDLRLRHFFITCEAFSWLDAAPARRGSRVQVPSSPPFFYYVRSIQLYWGRSETFTLLHAGGRGLIFLHVKPDGFTDLRLRHFFITCEAFS
jgi:hypothetical protein